MGAEQQMTKESFDGVIQRIADGGYDARDAYHMVETLEELKAEFAKISEERDDLKKRLAGIKDRVLAGSTSGVFWREEIIKIIEEAE